MRRQAIQAALKRIGLRPQRAAGQHFLVDESVVERMLVAAKVKKTDEILEIGPGLGILTRSLLVTGAQVTGVELDRRLAGYLEKELQGHKNFRLINQDFFKIRLDQLFIDGEYKVVANVPYSSTSLLLRNLMTTLPRPKSITVMIQKEVAQRMTAEPGAMSLLSLMTQYYSQTKILFEVPRTSFLPPPEVTSAVIHSVLLPLPDPVEVKQVFQLARAAFAGKRKQLQNSLAHVLPLDSELLIERLLQLGISPSARPQELAVDDWRRLAKNLF